MNTKLVSSLLISAPFALSAVAFVAGFGLVAFTLGVCAMIVTIAAHDYSRPHYCGDPIAIAAQALPLAA